MKTQRFLSRIALFVLASIGSSGQALAQNKPTPTASPIFIDTQSAQWQACEGLPGCKFVPLRGNAKREASEAMFQLGAGVIFPKHWHTSAEHVVVLQGRLSMNLENGERYSVGPGAFLYNPGGMIHWGDCAPGAACVYYVYDDQPYDVHLVD